MFKSKTTKIIKEFLPPIIIKYYRENFNKYGFFGTYKSWQEACENSTGYDCPKILNKVCNSLLKVKKGEAIYERDSVIFDEVQYAWPVLAGLLKVAVENGNKLSVLDFGGSLGSSYYQCKNFLSNLDELKWNIVEQEQFVLSGKEYFENEQLKFYFDIDTCIKFENPDIVLLLGVIQYLENPYDFLEKLVQYGFKYIIFDRTFFAKTKRDIITLHKVPNHIYDYDAVIPVHLLNLEKFLNILLEHYEKFADFEYPSELISSNHPLAQEKGFIFRKFNKQ